MKGLDVIALILVIVGGINWGLVGIFDFNLVGTIFTWAPVIARIIYVLVGLAALWSLMPLSRMFSSQT
jgi:uncharacterized membrane protein YuzA (DUF378 family)